MAQITAPPSPATLTAARQTSAVDEAEGKQFMAFFGAVTGGGGETT